MDKIIEILPKNIVSALLGIDISQITEIRLRVGKKVFIKLKNKEVIRDCEVNVQTLVDILKAVSLNSIYSIQNSINLGYITAPRRLQDRNSRRGCFRK